MSVCLTVWSPMVPICSDTLEMFTKFDLGLGHTEAYKVNT